MPEERWRTWEPVLPAPGAFAMRVVSRLDACGPGARRLVEAAAVLGGTVSLSVAAVLADVPKPVDALDEAVDLTHLTHIYAKLGVGSRAELAAQFRDSEMAGRPGRER